MPVRQVFSALNRLIKKFFLVHEGCIRPADNHRRSPPPPPRPPPLLPFPCLRLTANILPWRIRRQEDLSLFYLFTKQNFWPAFGGDHRRRGGPAKPSPPLLCSNTSLGTLFQPLWHTHTPVLAPTTTDGQHVAFRNLLAVCYICYISGGEHPPNSAVLEKALCGACLRRCGRDAEGQKQHL